MMSNLLLAFVENADPKPLEEKLIAELNPPLNLEKNTNMMNKEFRALLSKLRCRPVIGSAEHFTSSMKTTIKKNNTYTILLSYKWRKNGKNYP